MDFNNPTYRLQKLIVDWRNSKEDRKSRKPETPQRAIETLETLIRSGADLDAVEQLTPCIPYVFWDPDLITFFLQRGREINARDYAGNTALHLAAFYSSLPAIKFLLEHEADPNVRNKYGDTPLWKAITAIRDKVSSWPKNMEESFLVMLEGTTDMTVRNGEGLTYLHALHFNFNNFKKKSDIYRLLVNSFPDVDVRATKQSLEITPLMSACRNLSDTELCQILINERNADVNARDMFGRTPLYYALTTDDIMAKNDCIEFLLSSGAEPSAFLTCERAYSNRFSLYKLVPIFGDKIQLNQYPVFHIDMYEMAGAQYILNDVFDEGLDCWKRAHRIRTFWKYPKPPSSDDQKAMYKVENEFMTEADLDNLFNDTENDKIALYKQALLTLHRISKGTSWCWSLMETLIIIMDKNHNHTQYLFVQEMLPHVEANMSDREAESFLHEEITYRFFELFDYYECSMYRIMFRSLFANHIQFFLKLVIAPLKWWVENVGNQVPSLAKYQNYVNSLTRIHQDGLISPEIAEQFFKTLVSLDPRDAKGNGLLHLACQSNRLKAYNLAHLLIESGANVSAENLIGQTSMELLPGTSDAKVFAEKKKALILKMLSRGAHLDYQTVPSFQHKVLAQESDHFNPLPYVTLQCLSARVLARSNINYKVHLPKTLRTFVDKHFYDQC